MPHITYDYTVPRTPSPALRTAPPTIDAPLYLHPPESSQKDQVLMPADSRATQDFNSTWISLPSDDARDQLQPQEEPEDLSFSSQAFFQSNFTAQTRDWGWEQGKKEEDKFGFQIRQDCLANRVGEEEEVAVGGKTDLGLFLFLATLGLDICSAL